MDVFCSTCLEPWDTYHLRHDEIYETELAEEEIAVWLALPAANQLNTLYREAFRTVGWEFGQSLLNVLRCPCCPADAQPDPERVAIKAALEGALGDDPDGLAATFEDHRL
jgi:hypothetical protein